MLITSLFFPQLIGLFKALFFLDRLLGFLLDGFSNIIAFHFFLQVSLLILQGLDLHHVELFRTISLFFRLYLLLPFKQLVVQAGLEPLLELALLS